jgi:hypothetical protein
MHIRKQPLLEKPMDSASPSQRITSHESPFGLEIVIPASRNPSVTLFYPLMIITWGIVAYFLISSYFDIEYNGNKNILLFGLVICSLFCTMFIYFLIYNFVGKERILVKHPTLSVKTDVHGYGITRKYDIRQISNLRTEVRVSSFALFVPEHNSKISFDYKGDTYGFGVFYDEAEAQAVINKLQMHHVAIPR